MKLHTPPWTVFLLLLTAAAAVPLRAQDPGARSVTPPFEAYLELLRQQAGIPGMSAALVQDGQIVWERGFGFQDQESRIPATPDTPYLVGDVTQTLAAVLLLQCVEERHLSLDEPVRQYGVTLPEPTATLRHLLSHTSAGNPGEAFRYDPERFAQLTTAVERCVPQPYRKTVAHRLLERLAMKDSVPGRDIENPGVGSEDLFTPAAIERYTSVLARLAVPYKLDKRGHPVRADALPVEGISAAAGLVSTVRDLARFDAALEEVLLREETRTAAWTRVLARNGTAPVPTGLGWFVQNYEGEPVVWHFGLLQNAYSSLVIKLPSRHVTLILLANSDGLSAPFQLSNGDVTRSLFATVFLRLFI